MTNDSPAGATEAAPFPDVSGGQSVEPATSPSRPGVPSAMLVAIVAGVVIGAAAGAVMRGSGMMATNLLVGTGLLVALVVVGAGGLAAGAAGRGAAAGVFVVVTVIATAGAYAVAPGYRGPDAGIDRPGRVTLRLTEPTRVEWSEAALCRTRDRDTPVFRVSANHEESRERSASVTLDLGDPGSPGGQELWISVLALPAGVTQYVAPSGRGLEVVLTDADGGAGHARFTAPREPGALPSGDPEPDSLAGTLEWACDPPAAG